MIEHSPKILEGEETATIPRLQIRVGEMDVGGGDGSIMLLCLCSPPVNTKSMVYKWGMVAGGNADDWDTVWQKYQTEVVPQEKINLLRALAMTKSPWLLAK